jgi:7,8-dihydro-6-hydroxymethylpterin-pyrophosphokinase
MARVYLGLGSNLGDRLALLRAAVHALAAESDVRVVETSRLYESEPW